MGFVVVHIVFLVGGIQDSVFTDIDAHRAVHHASIACAMHIFVDGATADVDEGCPLFSIWIHLTVVGAVAAAVHITHHMTATDIHRLQTAMRPSCIVGRDGVAAAMYVGMYCAIHDVGYFLAFHNTLVAAAEDASPNGAVQDVDLGVAFHYTCRRAVVA